TGGGTAADTAGRAASKSAGEGDGIAATREKSQAKLKRPIAKPSGSRPAKGGRFEVERAKTAALKSKAPAETPFVRLRVTTENPTKELARIQRIAARVGGLVVSREGRFRDDLVKGRAARRAAQGAAPGGYEGRWLVRIPFSRSRDFLTDIEKLTLEDLEAADAGASRAAARARKGRAPGAAGDVAAVPPPARPAAAGPERREQREEQKDAGGAVAQRAVSPARKPEAPAAETRALTQTRQRVARRWVTIEVLVRQRVGAPARAEEAPAGPRR
ncbi:MAG: hypothetical protein ACYS9X_31970, partial [Planctomycetota bacterium]